MSTFGGSGVDAADAGGRVLPSTQPVEVGTIPAFPVESVASYVASPVSPYPTIVDPFKRRTALREYFRGLRGENKENERGSEGDGKSPASSLPKQKTLGLCRRHVLSPIIAVSSDGVLRDKRKFNAPRQTPEKRQRPVESEFGPELSRGLDLGNQMVGENVCEDDVSQTVREAAVCERVELEGQAQIMDEGEIPKPLMVYTRAKDVSPAINRQPQRSRSLSLRTQTPNIRKPLTPVHLNQQASHGHSSAMPLKPNFSGHMECEGGVSSESLFQLASGKRYQPSAAAKARALSMFESDAEFADLLGFE